MFSHCGFALHFRNTDHLLTCAYWPFVSYGQMSIEVFCTFYGFSLVVQSLSRVQLFVILWTAAH